MKNLWTGVKSIIKGGGVYSTFRRKVAQLKIYTSEGDKSIHFLKGLSENINFMSVGSMALILWAVMSQSCRDMPVFT